MYFHKKLFHGLLLVMLSLTLVAGACAAPEPELSPVESWQKIGSLMKSARDLAGEGQSEEAVAKIEESKSLYQATFQEEAGKLDQPTDALITQAFDHATTSARAGDKLQVNLQRQYVDKSIYKIAFLVLEEELVEGEIAEAEEWFALLAEKFKLYKDGQPKGAAVFMDELKREPEELDELRPRILEELRAVFLLKVGEEVAETIGALEKGDIATASEKAIEGLVYYRSIQPDVRTLLGEGEESELFHELEELVENALAGNLAEAEGEAEEITSLLASYKTVKLGGGLAVVASDLVGVLGLIVEEYEEAVSGGKIVDQSEYEETRLFLERARKIVEENREALAEADAALATELIENLDRVAAIVESLGDPHEVEEIVGQSSQRLASVAAKAQPVAEGPQAVVAEINQIMEKALHEYEEGETEEAYEYAANAYLDGFEHLESDLIEEDKLELVEDLELKFKALRDGIRDGKPPAELEELSAAIDKGLEEALEVLQ